MWLGVGVVSVWFIWKCCLSAKCSHFYFSFTTNGLNMKSPRKKNRASRPFLTCSRLLSSVGCVSSWTYHSLPPFSINLFHWVQEKWYKFSLKKTPYYDSTKWIIRSRFLKAWFIFCTWETCCKNISTNKHEILQYTFSYILYLAV